MKVLLLGGVSEAVELAKELSAQNIEVVYSIAGRVRQPELSCEVISGGFKVRGGLLHYLKEQSIDFVIDATHPFAKSMSDQAVKAAEEHGLQCWRLARHVWAQQDGDQWIEFESLAELYEAIPDGQNLFLTNGQVEEASLNLLVSKHKRVVLRTAVAPNFELNERVIWLKAIGPFDVVNERKLLEQHNITVMVSKQSGGSATYAKIEAARALNIPVYMLMRPSLLDAHQTFFNIEDCVRSAVSLQQGLQ